MKIFVHRIFCVLIMLLSLEGCKQRTNSSLKGDDFETSDYDKTQVLIQSLQRLISAGMYQSGKNPETYSVTDTYRLWFRSYEKDQFLGVENDSWYRSSVKRFTWKDATGKVHSAHFNVSEEQKDGKRTIKLTLTSLVLIEANGQPKTFTFSAVFDRLVDIGGTLHQEGGLAERAKNREFQDALTSSDPKKLAGVFAKYRDLPVSEIFRVETSSGHQAMVGPAFYLVADRYGPKKSANDRLDCLNLLFQNGAVVDLQKMSSREKDALRDSFLVLALNGEYRSFELLSQKLIASSPKADAIAFLSGGSDFWSPIIGLLAYARNRDAIVVAQKLIDQGVTLDSKNKTFEERALYGQWGQYDDSNPLPDDVGAEMVDFLLKQKVAISDCNRFSRSPLLESVIAYRPDGSQTLAKLLSYPEFQQQCNQPSGRSGGPNTTLGGPVVAAIIGDKPQTLRLLVQAGAKLDGAKEYVESWYSNTKGSIERNIKQSNLDQETLESYLRAQTGTPGEQNAKEDIARVVQQRQTFQNELTQNEQWRDRMLKLIEELTR